MLNEYKESRRQSRSSMELWKIILRFLKESRNYDGFEFFQVFLEFLEKEKNYLILNVSKILEFHFSFSFLNIYTGYKFQ